MTSASCSGESGQLAVHSKPNGQGCSSALMLNLFIHLALPLCPGTVLGAGDLKANKIGSMP